MEVKNPKLKTITCYLDHSSEALKQADVLFAEQDGDLVVKTLEDYLGVIRLGYKTFVSTLEDCSGRKVKIELGDSVLANTLEGLITGLLNGQLLTK